MDRACGWTVRVDGPCVWMGRACGWAVRVDGPCVWMRRGKSAWRLWLDCDQSSGLRSAMLACHGNVIDQLDCTGGIPHGNRQVDGLLTIYDGGLLEDNNTNAATAANTLTDTYCRRHSSIGFAYAPLPVPVHTRVTPASSPSSRAQTTPGPCREGRCSRGRCRLCRKPCSRFRHRRRRGPDWRLADHRRRR